MFIVDQSTGEAFLKRADRKLLGVSITFKANIAAGLGFRQFVGQQFVFAPLTIAGQGLYHRADAISWTSGSWGRELAFATTGGGPFAQTVRQPGKAGSAPGRFGQ